MHTALALCLLALPAPADDGFVPLFDGRSLAGWTPRGGGVFSVDGGTILGVTGTGEYGWLCTEKRYGDFVLELEGRHEGTGNSGIQVRSRIDDKGVMIGYQFDFDRTRPSTGRLYDEARRKLLQDVPHLPEARQAVKPDAWNTIRIECVADRLRSWVNGVPIVDYVDSVDLDGLVALQVHSGKDVRVRFRNIRIKDLGRRTWIPLWDGKTLDGWRATGKGTWTVEDGSLCGRASKSVPEFGHLVHDAVRKDFTLRLQFKPIRGDSGLYLRGEEGGFGGWSGLQVQIDPGEEAGGLYEMNGRGWLARPAADRVRRLIRRDEWNTLTVSARGTRIAVQLNDAPISELPDDDAGRREGRLALQLHGGQDVHVLFRAVEILSDPR